MNDSQPDIIIVGAGIVGSILANKLGQAGVKVLLIEAGDTLYFDPKTGADQRQPLLDRYYEATARVPNSPYPNLRWAPMPFVDTLGDDQYYYGPAYNSPDAPEPQPEKPKGGSYGRFSTTYTRIVGGTTYHWLGTCLRYVPATFREKTLYGHSTDWPFTYDELQSWYWHAENEIGVSGDSQQQLGAPRGGRPYPMPMILPSYTDRVMAERLAGLTYEGLPVLVESTPQGRNSIPYQDRPPCAGSTNCVPICPIQAKYDATVHLKRALQPALDPEDREGSRPVELWTSTVVSKVNVAADGSIESLEYRRPPETPGGPIQTGKVSARQYVLAIHGIETPKLLLSSASDQNGLASGVANGSDCVGRYLMDHNVRIAWGMADVPLYPFRGPLSTSGIESLRDGPFRRSRAAFRVEIEAIGANWATNSPFGVFNEHLAKSTIGKALWQNVGWDTSRQVQLDALLEPKPNPDSRVTLARDGQGELVTDELGIARPRLDFVLDDYTLRGDKAFQQVADLVITRMSGGAQTKATVVDGWFGAGHVMGTCRMGTEASASVTNQYGQTWQHRNLWLTGSALFPTVGSANPTLTIVAVTLRQVDRILEALRE